MAISRIEETIPSSASPPRSCWAALASDLVGALPDSTGILTASPTDTVANSAGGLRTILRLILRRMAGPSPHVAQMLRLGDVLGSKVNLAEALKGYAEATKLKATKKKAK